MTIRAGRPRPSFDLVVASRSILASRPAVRASCPAASTVPARPAPAADTSVLAPFPVPQTLLLRHAIAGGAPLDAKYASAIDRIAPSVRPDRRAVMRHDWHHLLFLHWAVPADRLRPL